MPPVGSPPITGAAVHLFLSDELRHAVLDGATTVVGQSLFGFGRDVIRIEILTAHIGDYSARRRDGRIGRKTVRVYELHGCLLFLGCQLVVVELAVQGKK